MHRTRIWAFAPLLVGLTVVAGCISTGPAPKPKPATTTTTSEFPLSPPNTPPTTAPVGDAPCTDAAVLAAWPFGTPAGRTLHVEACLTGWALSTWSATVLLPPVFVLFVADAGRWVYVDHGVAPPVCAGHGVPARIGALIGCDAG